MADPNVNYELVESTSNTVQPKSRNPLKWMRWYEWLLAIAATIIPLLGGFLGARMFNHGAYKRNEMEKPSFAPPSWFFSPVWVTMYLLMGIASFVLYKLGGGLNNDTIPPLLLYLLQLLAAWCWTPLFFGFAKYGAALCDVSIMWALVLACLVTFWKPSKVACLLMLPHFIWLSFAMTLNYSIVCLNGCSHNDTKYNN